jgi:hypothetical protein
MAHNGKNEHEEEEKCNNVNDVALDGSNERINNDL